MEDENILKAKKKLEDLNLIQFYFYQEKKKKSKLTWIKEHNKNERKKCKMKRRTKEFSRIIKEERCKKSAREIRVKVS